MSFDKIDDSLPKNINTFNMLVKCKLICVPDNFTDMIYYILITNKNCDQLHNIVIDEYSKEDQILLKVFVSGLQVNITLIKNGSISICAKNMTCIIQSIEILYTLFKNYNMATYSSYFNPLDIKNIGTIDIKHIGGIYKLFNDDGSLLIDLYDLHRTLVENKHRCMSMVSVGINTELTCLHIKHSYENKKEFSIYIFSRGTVIAIDMQNYKQLVDCYNFVVQITKDYIFSSNNLHSDLVDIKHIKMNDVTDTNAMDCTNMDCDNDINNIISSMNTVCL